MKTKYLLLAAAAGAAGLVLYARSSAGAKSTCPLVQWTRSKLASATKTAATGTTVATTDGDTVRAADTDDTATA